MPSGKPFPDAQAVLIAWARATFPGITAKVTLPANLLSVLPVIQPVRIGGPTDATIDRPTVDIDVYADDAVAAYALARQVQTALQRVSGAPVSYGAERAVIADVRCSQGPSWRPYENGSVYRVGATYQIAMHAA